MSASSRRTGASSSFSSRSARALGVRNFSTRSCSLARGDCAREVLDEGDVERGRVVEALEDRGNGPAARQLGRAPAALAGDDLVALARGTDEDRLQDAVLLDGGGELLEGLLVPGHARLRGV